MTQPDSLEPRRDTPIVVDGRQQHLDIAAALTRAQKLSARHQRVLLGVTGPPGAGKSTLSARLQRQLGDACAVVPMDGYHLSTAELDRRGLRHVKGCPDTFDAHGFVSVLQRLKTEDATVYVPEFDRALEQPISGAIGVPPGEVLVLVEGNYLLLDSQPWDQVRPLLDEVWYCNLPGPQRLQRLVQRHVVHGRSAEEAVVWANQVDQANADLIEASRLRANFVIDMD